METAVIAATAVLVMLKCGVCFVCRTECWSAADVDGSSENSEGRRVRPAVLTHH